MKPFMLSKAGLMTAVCFALILFQSCSKDDSNPEAKTFEIAFTNETIGLNKVDSVTASFSRAGQAPNFTRTLKKATGASRYYLAEGDLKEGNWYATINVYTTEDQGSRRKYQLKKEYASLFTQIYGPKIKADNEWNPFVIITHKTSKIELIVPERQEVSTFELNIPAGKAYDYLYVERTSYDKNNLVIEYQDWDVNGNIAGKINNSTALFEYTERLKLKKWNSSEILVSVQNSAQANDVVFLYYKYNNRYTPAL